MLAFEMADRAHSVTTGEEALYGVALVYTQCRHVPRGNLDTIDRPPPGSPGPFNGSAAASGPGISPGRVNLLTSGNTAFRTILQ